MSSENNYVSLHDVAIRMIIFFIYNCERNSEHRRIAYPGIYRVFIQTAFRLILPLVWLGFEIPSQMWREFWNFFIPAGSAWFLPIPNKYDGAFKEAFHKV